MLPTFHKLVAPEFLSNCRLFAETGFSEPEKAVELLTRLRETATTHHSDAASSALRPAPEWYKTLQRVIQEAPQPMVVLDAVERFVNKVTTPEAAFELFNQTPRSLEVLARLACGSTFLTQALLNQPESLRELTTERRTAAMKSREEFLEEANTAICAQTTTDGRLQQLRRYQRREILRIGMCDVFGLLALKFVTLQISLLADAMVQVCLQMACDTAGVEEAPFAVIALGKHGGEELNYSSDIDLVLIAHSDSPVNQKIARRLIDALSDQMSTGFLYRVDMRLRPWGDAGPLVTTPESYKQYLRSHAELWEKQALLKARVIAGAAAVGEELLSQLPTLLFTASKEEILHNVRSMKGQIEERLRQRGKLASEVKLGAGSIRDVEFLVQALQLIHGGTEARLASANTLDALVRLAEFGILDVTKYRQLREGYIFLRTVEHALQLLHNQQTHELPADARQQEWLARRMDYPGETELLLRFNEHRVAVRSNFDDLFSQNTAVEPSVTTIADKRKPAGEQQKQSSAEQELQSPELHAMLRDLDDGHLCRVHCRNAGHNGQQRQLTIVAPSMSGMLSMICGSLFIRELDIHEGYAESATRKEKHGVGSSSNRFLGYFLCNDTTDRPASESQLMAANLEESLGQLIRMSQSGQQSAVRELLLKQFCQSVTNLTSTTVLSTDLTISVSRHESADTTVLQISADRSFGFLFELSNALDLCGFGIVNAQIGEANGRISDVLHVTEANGDSITNAMRLEELRTVVTLIKQFTNWLPTNNAPHQALIRFRDLLQQLQTRSQWETELATLSHPEALRAIGQVLGLSRHLWEDFLQVQPQKLLPLLTDADQLQRRISKSGLWEDLKQLTKQENDLKQSTNALNEFKDYHLFRIDLRHLLGHCGAFGEFSREITELAEVVVDCAFRTAFRELTGVYGTPLMKGGAECAFTVAALGKFGGIEMGFASDLEVFVVFADDGHTNGSSRISTAVFFERLVARVTEIIQCRHKGIFTIDLRMRPYGQAGSPAVSLRALERYFQPDGDAWPYERQSLVKLRCVAGCAEFGDKVRQTCDDLIYGTETFNFDAMRAMREKQVRQLVRGGTVNAKLSDGGLVDCEYAVQALQLTFGAERPSLRTPNTLQALSALSAEGLLSKSEHDRVRKAYMFLRELIDCLRMSRGNAEDLTVPPANSTEFRQLAGRMDAVHDSPLPLEELESQLSAVNTFSARAEDICTGD